MTASEREALVKRVRYEVEWYAERGSGDIEPYKVEVVRDDLRALVTEVERLTRERDQLKEIAEDASRLMHESLITQRKVYDADLTGLTAEVERRREEVSVLRMFIGKNEVEEANEELANLDAARTTGGRDA